MACVCKKDSDRENKMVEKLTEKIDKKKKYEKIQRKRKREIGKVNFDLRFSRLYIFSIYIIFLQTNLVMQLDRAFSPHNNN